MELDRFFAEWEQRANVTKDAAQALPPDQLGWSPHEKSMSAGEQIQHVVKADIWFATIAAQGRMSSMDELECPEAPKDSPDLENLLIWYDAQRKRVSDLLQQNKGDLAGTFDFYGRPSNRMSTLWSGVIHHNVHHGGQLALYIRMLGGKVPPICGPTADVPFGK